MQPYDWFLWRVETIHPETPTWRRTRDHYEVLSQLMLPVALVLRGRDPYSHFSVKILICIEVTEVPPRSSHRDGRICIFYIETMQSNVHASPSLSLG